MFILEAAACRCLQDLEILEPDWLALLKQWAQAPELPGFAPQDPEKLERIAVYFAFRYLLKAVNDELVKLEKTGEAAKIYDVWFGPATKTPQPRAFTIEAK